MKFDILKLYLPALLLIAAAFYVTIQFIEPPPPHTIRIATGSKDGAYYAFARDYSTILAEDDVTLEIVETSGSVENLKLLQNPDDPIDVAFVQGGIGTPQEAPELIGLASLYYEPLWVFVRAGEAPAGRLELVGKRLAAGAEGSGTRALLDDLLAANQLLGKVTLQDIGGQAAAEALRGGAVDYAFFVAGVRSSVVQTLLNDPSVVLLSMVRAPAYARNLRYLSDVTIPEGTLDLASNRPNQENTLIAPAATLVAHEDLHPALIELLLRATVKTHKKGDVLAAPGRFPAADLVTFPVSPDAERYLTKGPSFLQRYLPFWVANIIDRLWILIIPILTILIPLVRIAPPTYRWRVRSRIYRWYRDLRSIECELRDAQTTQEQQALKPRLEQLQADVGKVEVPLAYSESLYHLRLHIRFVLEQSAQSESSGTKMP